MPVSHYHAVVWMDHHEARVVYFNPEESEESLIHAPSTKHHIHSHSGTPSGTHQTSPASYLAEIAAALADAKLFLLTGPSTAKTEFVKYVAKHVPQLLEKLDRVETLDKVSDGQLLAEARRYFKMEDRMLPQGH